MARLDRRRRAVDSAPGARDTAVIATGNAELVRASFDAFLRGDWHALSDVMHPEVEWLWHEPGDWDCHDRRKVLATLFERQREAVVTGLDAVVEVDESSSLTRMESFGEARLPRAGGAR
jgi:ketosteroid isomerase-like protein